MVREIANQLTSLTRQDRSSEAGGTRDREGTTWSMPIPAQIRASLCQGWRLERYNDSDFVSEVLFRYYFLQSNVAHRIPAVVCGTQHSTDDTDTRASDGTRSLSARASKHLNSNSLVASPEARSHYVRHRCGATPAAARSATMHELSGVKRKAHSPSS